LKKMEKNFKFKDEIILFIFYLFNTIYIIV